MHAQYSAGQKASLDIVNKGVCPGNLATLLKLDVWLGGIHSKATGNHIAQGSRYRGHDVAHMSAGQISACCREHKLTKVIADREGPEAGPTT